MRTFTFLFCALGCLAPLLGASGSIVSVTRKLRMSYSEPPAGRDFYVNLGARHGIRPGDKLLVQRTVSSTDAVLDHSIHLIPVVLGEMRVVAVGETACIAHQDSLASEIPYFQYSGFMVGDDVLTKSGLPLGSSTP